MQRRTFLASSLLAALPARPALARNGFDSEEKLPVAAIVTEYRPGSHADVIVGKILEGFRQDGSLGPNLQLASLYVDQFPDADMSRSLAKKFGFPIAPTIDDAITLGTNRVQVEGVLSIGEHGDYPLTPDTRQQMYPRRRFFDEIVAAFDRCGQVVPIFNDKGIGFSTQDAMHMVETAGRKGIPFMAGSSVPVAWRRPEEFLPKNCEIESALTIGYSGIEVYGFHTLEVHQCQVERRRGGESGIAKVRAVTGARIQQAASDGYWSIDQINAALSMLPQKRSLTADHRFESPDTFFLIDHRDGLRSCVAMLHGMGDEFVSAIQVRGESSPRTYWFQLENGPPYGHFAYLLRAIEHLFRSKQAAYPVERTLLTTCILDRVMHSLADQERAYQTPELDLSYQPTDWPFAPGQP